MYIHCSINRDLFLLNKYNNLKNNNINNIYEKFNINTNNLKRYNNDIRVKFYIYLGTTVHRLFYLNTKTYRI